MPSGPSSSGGSRFQWEFDAGHGSWQMYADAGQRVLEQKYRDWEGSGRSSNKRKAEVNLCGHVYDLDLEAGQQTRRDTGRVRKMRRRLAAPDPEIARLQEQNEGLCSQLLELQRELRETKANSQSGCSGSAKSGLLELQKRLPIFRVCRDIPRFSSPSENALRKADLAQGCLVLAVDRHETTVGNIRRLWLELSCGGFIRESPVDLEACTGACIEEQCNLLAHAVREGPPTENTPCADCICPVETSPLARETDYVARMGFSCCSTHAQTEMVVELLDPSSPHYKFVHRIFENSLVPHRVSYDSEEMAERPKLQVEKIYRIFNPELIHRYDLERRSILSRSSNSATSCVAPHAEYVFHPHSSGLQPSNDEFFLWHGTKPEVVQHIERDGFDPRRGGSAVGKMFGVGTYLAQNASKSDLYGDGNPSGNAQGQVHCALFVKALLGRPHYTKTAMNASKPPDDSKGKPLDSIVALSKSEGGCVDLREYVVFKPAQVLPLCRVVYRHLPECKCCRCIR